MWRLWLALCLAGMLPSLAVAQQGNPGVTGLGKGVTCPANSGAASIEVLPANGGRASFTMSNDSSVGSIRFGFVGAGTPNLDDTNSAILLTGGSYSNSTPNGYIGRVVCESNSTSAVTIHVTEISVQ